MNAVVNPNVMERLLKTAPVSHHAAAALKIIKTKASAVPTVRNVNAASTASAVPTVRNVNAASTASAVPTVRNVNAASTATAVPAVRNVNVS